MIVSYPKCGRTWVANVLYYYLQLKSNVSERTELFFLNPNFKALSKQTGYKPILLTHDVFSLGAPITNWNIYSLANFHRKMNKVLLVRDPRDILVSLYWHMRGRVVKSGLPEDMSIGYFLDNFDLGLDALIKFLNIWVSATTSRNDIRLYRYEDLLGSWAINKFIWTELFEYLLNETVDGARLSEAVEYFHIDSLKNRVAKKKKHATNLIGLGGRIRQGKANNFYKILSAEELELINARLKKSLSIKARKIIYDYYCLPSDA